MAPLSIQGHQKKRKTEKRKNTQKNPKDKGKAKLNPQPIHKYFIRMDIFFYKIISLKCFAERHFRSSLKVLSQRLGDNVDGDCQKM
jgi:hypothetical protein